MEEVTRGMNAEDALNMDLSPVQPRGDSSPILTDPQMERFHHERFRIQETSAEGATQQHNSEHFEENQ